MSNIRQKLLALPVIGSGLMLADQAHATGVDYSSLTGAVDFTTTTAAILTVFAALALVYVAFKGASLIMRAIKRG